jgi:sterol desaturase/sphingolipid hydroxylase (fatty acid hydroxylase superfamily)
MEIILNYFNSISSSHRSIILVSGLAFFLLLESGIPLFRFEYKKVKHLLTNLLFTLTTLVINLIGAFLILMAADYNVQNGMGILNLIELPTWMKVLLGIMLLDLIGAWLIHWIEHNVKWMWGFHIIHHTDRYVDVTTGLRHHPGESIFRLLFTALAVFVSGASFGTVMLYQTFSAFFAHLTHANIKAIPWLDKILSVVFVTPHFHKIHHHYILPHTDRNYGNIFSLWDHLFNTSITIKNMDELTYGLDTHMDQKETSNIKSMMKIPFKAYRSPVGSKFSK